MCVCPRKDARALLPARETLTPVSPSRLASQDVLQTLRDLLRAKNEDELIQDFISETQVVRRSSGRRSPRAP
jgi:hypothetical protein